MYACTCRKVCKKYLYQSAHNILQIPKHQTKRAPGIHTNGSLQRVHRFTRLRKNSLPMPNYKQKHVILLLHCNIAILYCPPNIPYSGYFRGVKFSWAVNFWPFCGKIFMVVVFMSEILWFTSQPRKPQTFRPQHYTVYWLISAGVLNCLPAVTVITLQSLLPLLRTPDFLSLQETELRVSRHWVPSMLAEHIQKSSPLDAYAQAHSEMCSSTLSSLYVQVT